jgi:hypothetical protein
MWLNSQAPGHEDVRGSGGIAPLSLTSRLDGELPASRPGRFTPRAHWRGDTR